MLQLAKYLPFQFYLKAVFLLVVVLNVQFAFCSESSYSSSGKEYNSQLFLGLQSAGYLHSPYSTLIEDLNRSYTVNLGKHKKYGFSKKFYNLKNGQFVCASVEIKSETGVGVFVCAVKQADSKFSIRKMPKKGTDNWETLVIEQYINSDDTELSFYAFANRDSIVFRNLRITVHQSVPRLKEMDLELPGLNIFIPAAAKRNLESYAKSAIDKGVIGKEEKQSELGYLLYGNDSAKVDIRLKGDWTDHLSSGKESYRIKIKDEHAFNGMRTFSIHHPKTRNYMHEWLMHQLCFKENLLATKYEFIPVTINGVYKGIYAIEEHFEKHLIESKQRRESPILKYDESGTWALTVVQNKHSNKISLPVFESSIISLFKKKKTLASKSLKNLFVQGSKLMQLHKDLTKSAASITNLAHTAQYYALMELGNVEHGHQWHNKRFYYNPICQKLENIGFDMNPGHNALDKLYVLKKLTARTGPKSWQLIQPFLQNRTFKMYYLHYLKAFSNEAYLLSRFNELDESITENENTLAAEIEDFDFDKSFYFKRAAYIRSKLEEVDSVWEQRLLKNKPVDSFYEKRTYTRQDSLPYLTEVSVNAFVSEVAEKGYEIEICNYLLKPILVTGFIDVDGNSVDFENAIKMKHYTGVVACKKMILKEKPSKILFKEISKFGKLKKRTVLQWPKPTGETARIILENQFKIKSPYYTISDSDLVFKSGEIKLNELIYIPENYKVIINKGTNIELKGEGGIICAGSLSINGTSSHKVKIYSSDATNNGLTVLNGKKVIFKNVEFENMRSLNYKGWVLSGGVNIYDSNVETNNCKISNSKAEDAINFISCTFEISQLKIENVSSDGLDSDFCSGKISDSEFKNIGNDGLDFSGSYAGISNVLIDNAGDKGISCGEKSTIDVHDSTIKNCKVGLAVKDGSKVVTNNCSWLDLNIGFALFQKKPEYLQPKLLIKCIDKLESRRNVYSDHAMLKFYNFIMLDSMN
ncbi:MAG: CotH kinase family protein [Crocinitomicaceae bacterium]